MAPGRRVGPAAPDYTAIEWHRSALVVIDVQHDFVDGVAAVPGTAAVLPALADLIGRFREAGRPIAHIIRLYPPGSSDVDPLRRADIEGGMRVVAPGTRGAEIPAALTGGRRVELDLDALRSGRPQRLAADEAVFCKPRWSAFFRTDLLEWLTERGVTSVVVAGCNLPNCPRATLIDATERDLRAALVADATSQTTTERLDDLELIGVHVVTAAHVVERLRG